MGLIFSEVTIKQRPRPGFLAAFQKEKSQILLKLKNG